VRVDRGDGAGRGGGHVGEHRQRHVEVIVGVDVDGVGANSLAMPV
jgi:hypothetical protein